MFDVSFNEDGFLTVGIYNNKATEIVDILRDAREKITDGEPEAQEEASFMVSVFNRAMTDRLAEEYEEEGYSYEEAIIDGFIGADEDDFTAEEYENLHNVSSDDEYEDEEDNWINVTDDEFRQELDDTPDVLITRISYYDETIVELEVSDDECTTYLFEIQGRFFNCFIKLLKEYGLISEDEEKELFIK